MFRRIVADAAAGGLTPEAIVASTLCDLAAIQDEYAAIERIKENRKRGAAKAKETRQKIKTTIDLYAWRRTPPPHPPPPWPGSETKHTRRAIKF